MLLDSLPPHNIVLVAPESLEYGYASAAIGGLFPAIREGSWCALALLGEELGWSIGEDQLRTDGIWLVRQR
jgi:hypothetical protein